MPMKFAVAGATGKMGKMLIETILNDPNAELTGALEHSACPQLGSDAGAFLGRETKVQITADLVKGLAGAEYLIDFTRPDGTLLHAAVAQKVGVKMIIGTTGFTPEQLKQLQSTAQSIAIVFAPNMSVGVNATFKIVQVAAQLLNQGYDIEIVEAHHRHKVDAPSGTALKIGEVIAAAQGGQHSPQRQTWGHSQIINAWGEVLAERQESGEGLVWANFDGAEQAALRQRMPVELHRRD